MTKVSKVVALCFVLTVVSGIEVTLFGKKDNSRKVDITKCFDIIPIQVGMACGITITEHMKKTILKDQELMKTCCEENCGPKEYKHICHSLKT